MWEAFAFEFMNFYFIPGLVLGCIYALGAIGITLTFSILRFGNFAHGELMMLSGYMNWSVSMLFGMVFGYTLHPILAGIPTVLIIVIVFLWVDRFSYRPFRDSSRIMLVLASFGMMLIIRSAVQTLWGSDQIPFIIGIEPPNSWIQDMTGSIHMQILVPNKHLWIISGTAILAMSLHYFLSHTRMGKAMRAVADSIELAKSSGVDVEAVIRTTWIVTGICGAAGGIFIAMDTQFLDSNFGFRMLLPMFAAAILGGIGRPFGAVLGGLIIGLTEELAAYPWVGDVPLLSPGYKSAVSFFIMILMLIIRPSGLFKGRTL
ncbi:MAG: branched-chain amino acid ABC transporter permease [Alphaproteobacteria bacterium]|nr:branched-chain amino acid ABC transporter permease [Alphaproteobacteria bacterium]